MAINNINNLANSRLQNSGTSQGVATKPATSAESNRAATVKTDSVSLTSEAQQLQQMQKTLNTASTGNESRVESLKKAVASGEYKINSEAVARKMFSFEADLDKRLG
ncbi:flagellar biosynthesis anti-sigma factor FlgM [Aeromonas rivipollensis]|uniref:flagellar biosynthesis anti-sigma factor FlgM n=1 Tax=Aeromonas rivipollensis TaxID=948519 RepID=UPI0038D1CC93